MNTQTIYFGFAGLGLLLHWFFKAKAAFKANKDLSILGWVWANKGYILLSLVTTVGGALMFSPDAFDSKAYVASFTGGFAAGSMFKNLIESLSGSDVDGDGHVGGV